MSGYLHIMKSHPTHRHTDTLTHPVASNPKELHADIHEFSNGLHAINQRTTSDDQLIRVRGIPLALTS